MGHGFWQPFSELTSRLLMLPVSGWLISCVFRRSTPFCLSQLGMIVHPVFLPPLPCPMSSHSVFMVSCVQHLLVAWVDLLLFCCSSALTFVDAFWFACWCLLCWHAVVWGVQLLWAVGFWWVFPPTLDSSPRVFCSAFSCCKYCKVGVTFAFLCLPEDALGRLYSRFSLNKSLLMTRTACPILFRTERTLKRWIVVHCLRLQHQECHFLEIGYSARIHMLMLWYLWACQFPRNWRNSPQQLTAVR